LIPPKSEYSGVPRY